MVANHNCLGYSATGFNADETQPNEQNPFGNPADYPGYTSVNGPTWTNFITFDYNDTFMKTINFASGGAVVDSSIITPFSPYIINLKEQVYEKYLPNYGPEATSDHRSDFDWHSSDTLFALWIGINDIVGAAEQRHPERLDAVLRSYANLVDQLYLSGARNFLFFNIPPITRSPMSALIKTEIKADQARSVPTFNTGLTLMASNLSATYPDTWIHIFDAHDLFNRVLDSPWAFRETAAYKSTMPDFCKAYEHGTGKDWYFKSENCTYAVDEYFWLDFLHPTFRVMNVTAKEVAKELRERKPTMREKAALSGQGTVLVAEGP
jgi:hypothetical protein